MDYQNAYLREKRRGDELQAQIERNNTLETQRKRALDRVSRVFDEGLALVALVEKIDQLNPDEVSKRKSEMRAMRTLFLEAQNAYHEILK